MEIWGGAAALATFLALVTAAPGAAQVTGGVDGVTDATGGPPLQESLEAQVSQEVELAAAAAGRVEIPLRGGPLDQAFLARQLDFPRVARARLATSELLEARFRLRGISRPPAGLYLRVFKAERAVEVWVRPQGEDRYAFLVEYPICDVSGWFGPKRTLGDRQIPEGFYEIESFNPESEYHLSLRVDYPNRVDRRLGDGGPLGSDIYLHGGCSTVGCVPITDEHIQELYWLAVEARANGARRISVHIFPTRMDPLGMEWLQEFIPRGSDLGLFWERLRDGYEYFEEERRVPAVDLDELGLYRVTASPFPDGFDSTVPLGRHLLGMPTSPEAQVDAVSGTGLLGESVAPAAGAEAAGTGSGLLGESVASAAPLARGNSRLLGARATSAAPPEAAASGLASSFERGTPDEDEVVAWVPLLGTPRILGAEVESAEPAPGPPALRGFQPRQALRPGTLPYRPSRLPVYRP